MLSVIVTTLNSEQALLHSFSSLVPATAEGIVRDVLVIDRGSTDATRTLADAAGANWVSSVEAEPNIVELALDHTHRGEWLLFIRPDVMLESGWHNEAMAFIERCQRAGSDHQLAVLRYQSDDFGLKVRATEKLVNFAAQTIGLTHPCQGLLASRASLARHGKRRAKLSATTPAQILRALRAGRPTTLRSAAIRIASPQA